MTTATAVFEAHRVAVAYLFGSRAEGTARADSDHDVAVLFADAAPALGETALLADDLAALWGTPVDVVDLDRATLELRGRVAEGRHLLFSADEPRRVQFEVDTWKRWLEFRPALEEMTAGFLRRVASEGLR